MVGIPEKYIIRLDRAEAGGRRTVTVRRYSTTMAVNREEIKTGLLQSKLVFGKEFGIIQHYDSDAQDRNPRALCGLVGEKNVVLLTEEKDSLDYLRLRHVLISTMMVEFVASAGERLELLVFGDIRAKNHLWEMLKYDFAINPEPTLRYFKPEAIRKICEKYFDKLHEIDINPFEQDGWQKIRAADFKSYRGQFIEPSGERMKQIYHNKEIKIQSFLSILYDQHMSPMLRPCNVKFNVLRDSGVTFELPELEIPSHMTEFEYELLFYDFVRELYTTVIDTEDLFEPFNTRLIRQLSLLNPSSIS